MVNANSGCLILSGDPTLGDDCVESAWNEATELSVGKNWSDWDLWDVTNVLYESCLAEQVG